MTHCDLLILHAGELFSPAPESPGSPSALRTAGAVGGRAQEEATVIPDGAVAVVGETIAEVGTTDDLARRWRAAETLDAAGGAVTPAFTDPHAHPVFAGWRAEEFAARVSGRTTDPALETGIASTARTTAEATDAELVDLVRARLDSWLLAGTTLVECKSGYALTHEGEIRLLRLAREAADGHAVEIVTTLLAAHALPPEYAGRAQAYLDEVAWPATEEARRFQMAEYADVFVEPDLFPVEIAEPYLRRAAEIGLGVRVHADQLARSGGTAMAARLRAASADHLERAEAEDAAALAGVGTVAVLAPGAVLTMEGRGGQRPPARALAASGVPIALATDFNPGSSTLQSPALALGLACRLLGLTPEAAWVASTANAAASVGRGRTRGRLLAGYRADVCLWDVPRARDLAYQLDAHRPRHVVAGGRWVVRYRVAVTGTPQTTSGGG